MVPSSGGSQPRRASTRWRRRRCRRRCFACGTWRGHIASWSRLTTLLRFTPLLQPERLYSPQLPLELKCCSLTCWTSPSSCRPATVLTVEVAAARRHFSHFSGAMAQTGWRRNNSVFALPYQEALPRRPGLGASHGLRRAGFDLELFTASRVAPAPRFRLRGCRSSPLASCC